MGVRLRALASKMVLPLRKHGETRMKSGVLFIEVQLNVQKQLNLKFLVIIQSVTADSSLRSPTGGVEGLYPTPHIYEQMTA